MGRSFADRDFHLVYLKRSFKPSRNIRLFNRCVKKGGGGGGAPHRALSKSTDQFKCYNF